MSKRKKNHGPRTLPHLGLDISLTADRRVAESLANKLLKTGGNLFEPGDKFKFKGLDQRAMYIGMAKRLYNGYGKPHDYQQARNDKSFIKYLHTIGLSHIVQLAFDMRGKS